MKIVVSARGPALSAPVDPRFGRARWLLLYDTDDGSCATLDNAAEADAPQGAGVRSAQRVVDAGAGCVLTGRCGPKAFAVLQAAGVAVCICAEGSAADAVAAWQDGSLRAVDAPDGVPRH